MRLFSKFYNDFKKIFSHFVWIHTQILHRTTIMYFAIIRDSISKLKNLTNVIRSNAIIWKNSVSLIKVMLLFSALLKHFVWVFRWLFGKTEYSVTSSLKCISLFNHYFFLIWYYKYIFSMNYFKQLCSICFRKHYLSAFFVDFFAVR